MGNFFNFSVLYAMLIVCVCPHLNEMYFCVIFFFIVLIYKTIWNRNMENWKPPLKAVIMIRSAWFWCQMKDIFVFEVRLFLIFSENLWKKEKSRKTILPSHPYKKSTIIFKWKPVLIVPNVCELWELVFC